MEEFKKNNERIRKENEQRELEFENEKVKASLLRKMKFEAFMKDIEDARVKAEEKKINDQKKHAFVKQQQVELGQNTSEPAKFEKKEQEEAEERKKEEQRRKEREEERRNKKEECDKLILELELENQKL